MNKAGGHHKDERAGTIATSRLAASTGRPSSLKQHGRRHSGRKFGSARDMQLRLTGVRQESAAAIRGKTDQIRQ